MDVRAKQRLSYHVVFLPLTCVVAVSPHVNSGVRHFLAVLNKTFTSSVKIFMKKVIYILLFVLLAFSISPAQIVGDLQDEPVKIEAQPTKGFSYPYYLYVPKAMREVGARKQTQTILVIPNNAGKTDDDFAVHEADAKRKIGQNKTMTARVNVIILMPVFPRPKTDWKIYTHALDRDSMLTDKKEYRRFDLQLTAMIDDAREKLKAEKLETDKRVLMFGFSASAMFANRFTFLHPKRVKAAVIVSPGGWAIAPAAAYNGKALRYPIGAGGFRRGFGYKKFAKSSAFHFSGRQGR
jgi:predicted esterase